MPDSHDLHVLHDLIAAVRGVPGAPDAAVVELETEAQRHGEDEPGGGRSVIDAAREALSGLVGHPSAELAAGAGLVDRLEALMGRFEAAMADDRLSGPVRDAVIRAFDPVKAARDAALQREA